MSEPIEGLIAQARHSSDALRNAPFKIERESYADGVDALADALAEQAARITELEGALAQVQGSADAWWKEYDASQTELRAVVAERDGYAAAIERAKVDINDLGRPWHRVFMKTLATLRSADTSTAVQAIRDKAFEEAAALVRLQRPTNPEHDWTDWARGAVVAVDNAVSAIRSRQGSQ